MRPLILLLLGIVIASCITIATAGRSIKLPSTGTAPATEPAVFTPTPTITATPAIGLPAAAELWARLGALRASLHLVPYLFSPVLSAAASDQARWMVTTGLVTHIHPDGSTPAQRALQVGYTESWTCSEIIYMGGIATPQDAWQYWLTSPIHYAELTSAQHREAGVGIAQSATYGTAFVVVFGGFNPPTAQPPAVVLTAPVTYVVQPGDTLFRIATRYGLSVAQLAAANQIRDTGRIFVGQVLIIPLPATPIPLATP